MKKFYLYLMIVFYVSVLFAQTSVEPLIDNDWTTYTWPYNAYLPENINGPNGHEPNGCGPTSMAKILFYWEFPVNGIGILDFYSMGNHWYCNLENLNLNYSAMPYTLPYNATPAEYHETANLMLACSAAGETVPIWAPSQIENVPPLFVDYFNFSQTVELVHRWDYTREEWINIYKNELDNGRPIMMDGRTVDSPPPGEPGQVFGHWWICDGYNENDEFHINYAFGTVQGYYDIDDMGEYLAWNSAIIGLQPDLNGKSIELLTMNGEENFVPGDVAEIIWDTTNIVDIRIEFTVNDGYEWTELVTSIPASTGSYDWIVPNTYSNECRIKITDVEDININCKSENTFSIQPYELMLIYPNGGESFYVGNTISITWDNTPVEDIKIDYTINNGSDWIEISPSTPAAIGYYDWIIPNTVSDQCKIKITDVSNNAVFDQSNNIFSIMSYNSLYDIQFTTIPGTDGTYPSPLVGENVTVLGIVTATGYDGYSNSFFISSEEGDSWEGIYVYNADMSPEIGNLVQISGVVAEYYGFTEILSPVVTLISEVNPIPAPLISTTGNLSSSVNAEMYESCLIKVENVTVTQAPNTDNEWYVDDGSGECQVDDKIFNYNAVLGEQFSYIMGVLDYSWNEFGLLPRFEEDLLLTGNVIAEFLADPLSGSAPLEVQFTDQSVGNTITWEWDFDNDGFVDSSDQNPTYTYFETGTYTVILSVSDGTNYDTEEKIDYIEVTDTGIINENFQIKTEIVGNYPNPFNPSTQIHYNLGEAGLVQIEIYNMKGQRIITLVNQFQSAGSNSVIWNGLNSNNNEVSSGLFLYKLVFNGRVHSFKKCILLK